MKFFLTLVEGVAYNTIFLWPFLQTIKVSIIIKNNALVSEILVYKFNMYMMVPQISQESPKTSERLPFSLTASIPETQNNMEDRGRMDIKMELKIGVIHQRQIPGQH